VSIRSGWRVYEVTIPREAVGSSTRGVMTVTYVPPRVPKEADPVRFPSEARTCNLALDWVQIGTADFAAGSHARVPEPTPARTQWHDPSGRCLAGFGLAPGVLRDAIVPVGTELTKYDGSDTPRDLWIRLGLGHVGYVNGALSDVENPDYLRAWIEGIAGVPIAAEVSGPDCAGVGLAMGETTILPVYNYTVGESREVRLRVPTGGIPVASVTALRRDGAEAVSLPYSVDDGHVSFSDNVRYFGLYEVVRAPVGASVPLLETAPGCTTEVDIPVRNLTARPQLVSAELLAVTPTIAGRATSPRYGLPVALGPASEGVIRLAVSAREGADWGRKTAVLRLSGDGWESRQIVTVVVRPRPEVSLATPVIHASSATLSVQSVPNRYLAPPEIRDVRLRARDEDYSLGDLTPGQTADVALPANVTDGLARDGCFGDVPLTVSYTFMGHPAEQALHVRVGHADHPTVPPTAFGKVVSLNTAPEPVSAQYVRCRVDLAGRDPDDVSVRTAAADTIPSLIERTPEGPVLHAITNVPAKWNRCLFLCDGGDRGPASDLAVSSQDLGTGRGVLRVANGYYALTLDERAGGCATELRSNATGGDYAAGTFGASAGRFKELPPDGTALGDGHTIKDEMTRQRDSAGAIRVVLGGAGMPLVRVVVEGKAGYGITSRQEYTFLAGQPWFLVTATAERHGPGLPEEVCALDFRVERRGLTKVFPNWTGMVEEFERSQPHCGWRESVDVPELVTLMESPTPQNREAWSLGVLAKRGLDRLRVGWWPAKRPQPGRCTYGEVEFVADGARLMEGPVAVTCAVMLHSGHHVAGRELLADVRGRAPATFLLLPRQPE
jgi:hypothetical protein